MGKRRKAREYALQGLYIYETVKPSLDDILTYNWIEEEISSESKDFASKLINGTVDHIEEIDTLIKKHAKNWKFERIDTIDKSILRLSIFSILYFEDVPQNVTINEAIELGKKYGGDHSSQFINGILDTIKKSYKSKTKN